MNFYLYKITNLINQKIYIGVHSTEDMNDGYFGSGVVLKRAIKKYGKDNFKKEILELFDTFELMYIKENEIVDVDFINRKDTYNQKVGGYGGKPVTNDVRKKQSASQLLRFSKPEEIQKLSDSARKRFQNLDERIRTSKAVSNLWHDNDYRARQCNTRSMLDKTENNLRHSKFMKSLCLNKSHIDKMKLAYADNERNAKISKSNKGNSFGNKKCLIGGIAFDSIKTAMLYFN